MTSITHKIVGVNPSASTSGPETRNESTHADLPLSFLRGDESIPGIITYLFNGHPVRVVRTQEGPQWVAEDIVRATGRAWGGVFILRHVLINHVVPGSWRLWKTTPIATPSGAQNVVVLSERALLYYIAMSDSPEAFRLFKWVTCEALPALRWAGCSSIPASENPTLNAERALPSTTNLPSLGHDSPIVPENTDVQPDDPKRHGGRFMAAQFAAAAKGFTFQAKQVKGLAAQFDEMFTKVMASYQLYNPPVATFENKDLAEVSDLLGVDLDGLLELLQQRRVLRIGRKSDRDRLNEPYSRYQCGSTPYFHFRMTDASFTKDGDAVCSRLPIATPMGIMWLFRLLWSGVFNIAILKDFPYAATNDGQRDEQPGKVVLSSCRLPVGNTATDHGDNYLPVPLPMNTKIQVTHEDCQSLSV